MIKNCENCDKQFNTKDSRQKSCSKSCADVRRALWGKLKLSTVKTGRIQSKTPNYSQPPRADLPLPEELPAPYAKRVHDMWAALTGGDAPTRIA